MNKETLNHPPIFSLEITNIKNLLTNFFLFLHYYTILHNRMYTCIQFGLD